MRNVVPSRVDVEQPVSFPAPAGTPSTNSGAAQSVAAPSTSRSRRAGRLTTYDRVTRVGGLLVGVGLMLALWLVGGYFTLVWLRSIGLTFAGSGLAAIDAVLARGPATEAHWTAVLLAWSLPLAITLAEIGLWPTRTRHPFTWLIFLAVLAFSSFTTAAGVALSLRTDPLTAWVVGALLGVTLDLVPEKGVRVLWRLLWES
jgi:hypothetical protein